VLQLLTEIALFGEIYVFLQLSSGVVFGANSDYLHLETPKMKKVLLSRTDSIL
jgi:hypothetical protein